MRMKSKTTEQKQNHGEMGSLNLGAVGAISENEKPNSRTSRACKESEIRVLANRVRVNFREEIPSVFERVIWAN